MPIRADRLLPQLWRILSRTAPEPEDAVLLHRFLTSREEEAFAALVTRHGPMVLRICQRVLGNSHDAEDAFQATFLVLARKAASIRPPAALAAFLHGVACRVARTARLAGSRRRLRETLASELTPVDPHLDPLAELSAREAVQLLDEEVERLPQVYRLPVVLCCLEGLSQEEAARRLGWTPGSVKGRLERGRQRLQRRLAARGLKLALALALVEVSRAAASSLSDMTVAATVRGALISAAGSRAVSAQVAALAERGAQGMSLVKGKVSVVAVLLLGVVTAGAGMLFHPAPQPPSADTPGPKDRAAPEAGPSSPVRPGSRRWRFGTQIMALGYANAGKWLVIADGPRVRVLDAGTGKAVHSFQAQPYTINSMALAGDRVAVTGGDQVSYLWDVRRARKLRTFPAHKNGSQNIRISPDGRYVAATGDDVGRLEGVEIFNDYSVRVWDMATGKELAPFAAGLRKGIVGVFSPDSKQIAWASMIGGVHLCSLANGKELFHYKGTVGDLAFSPDGKTLACTTAGGVILLETRTGRERVVCRRKDQQGGIASSRVAFSPRGDTVAMCSENGSIVFWDTTTGKERGRIVLTVTGRPGYVSTFISAIAFAPDGKTLAAAPQDRTVRLLDVATKMQKNDTTR